MGQVGDGASVAVVGQSVDTDGAPVVSIGGELDMSNVETIEVELTTVITSAPRVWCSTCPGSRSSTAPVSRSCSRGREGGEGRAPQPVRHRATGHSGHRPDRRPPRAAMKQRRFPNTPASVGAARRFTAHVLDGVDTAVVDVVVLMVSELATNSVRHAASEFTVAIDRRPDEIRIKVTDQGSGRPTLQTPASTEPSGRGLRIVQAFADSWGITEASNDPGKTVWFSVALDARRPGTGDERAVEQPTRDGTDAHQPKRVPRRRTAPSATPDPRDRSFASPADRERRRHSARGGGTATVISTLAVPPGWLSETWYENPCRPSRPEPSSAAPRSSRLRTGSVAVLRRDLERVRRVVRQPVDDPRRHHRDDDRRLRHRPDVGRDDLARQR